MEKLPNKLQRELRENYLISEVSASPSKLHSTQVITLFHLSLHCQWAFQHQCSITVQNTHMLRSNTRLQHTSTRLTIEFCDSSRISISTSHQFQTYNLTTPKTLLSRAAALIMEWPCLKSNYKRLFFTQMRLPKLIASCTWRMQKQDSQMLVSSLCKKCT